MFNPHTKFEVSTITCNKDMKGNTKRNKNSSGDEIANVNFFYDDIAHVLQNTKKRTYFV